MTASSSGELDANIDKQRLAAIYAQALLRTTEKRQVSEAVLAELDELMEHVLGRFPDLELALASPRISPADKTGLLQRVLSGRVSNDLLTFLMVLARRGRLDCLRPIRRAARAELNRLRQRVAVQVTTATPLSPELQQRIAQRLQTLLHREVELQCRQDLAVIGGLVVRVGDTVFDGSVANQLARMKQETINNTVRQLREKLERFAVSG